MCQFEDCWDRKSNSLNKNHDITAIIKPEIGKKRPVLIIFPHKRIRLAIVIPFTSKKPNNKNPNALYIPVGIMPGVLGRSECWALCDMPQTVNICRLKTIFSGTKNNYQRRINQKNSILPNIYFKQIIEKSAIIINTIQKK